ncbi:hypothetical protein DFJ74DRAFT_709312 [Hyaloraphidium curvatum]|nr:hypothetical protein DFJ74DRAFT_709312 [Hyaloraphidium curvatum]
MQPASARLLPLGALVRLRLGVFAVWAPNARGVELRKARKHAWRLSACAMTADAGGPYSCERGAVLRLDASRSRGDIGAYEWGFEAAPPERPPGPYDPEMDPPRADAKKTASSAGGASVVVCMDVMVRVTVTSKSGDAKRSSEPVRIACIPRTVKPADVSKTDEIKKANLPLFPGQFDLGRNVCALDDGPVGKDEAQHYYHRPPGLQSWLDVGYRVQQVDDSVGGPGPFHGFWLVWLPHTLPICRQRAVNRKLYPKDPEGVYQHNEQRKQPRPPPKKGSDAPHPYVCGMGRFAASVAAHEGKHTELILESARREFARVEQRRGPVDPAGRIEGLCFADRAKLVTGADVEILYSDEEVGKATSGKEAEERIHEMLVADGFDDYAIVYLPDGKGGWATKEGVLGKFGD